MKERKSVKENIGQETQKRRERGGEKERGSQKKRERGMEKREE